MEVCARVLKILPFIILTAITVNLIEIPSNHDMYLGDCIVTENYCFNIFFCKT